MPITSKHFNFLDEYINAVLVFSDVINQSRFSAASGLSRAWLQSGVTTFWHSCQVHITQHTYLSLGSTSCSTCSIE